jgi:hypothetical protein
MTKDIKVMDTLKQYVEDRVNFGVSLTEHFANAVELTRGEPGISIEAIAKCFRYQFDEVELSALIHELNKGKL